MQLQLDVGCSHLKALLGWTFKIPHSHGSPARAVKQNAFTWLPHMSCGSMTYIIWLLVV